MQYDPKTSPRPIRPRPTRTHLVSMDDNREPWRTSWVADSSLAVPLASGIDSTRQPTNALESTRDGDRTTSPVSTSFHFKPLPVADDVDDISKQSTMHLMRLSGMMRAIKLPAQQDNSAVLSSPIPILAGHEEGYWPHGIQQTGALPVVNLYGREPFGRTLPRTPAIAAAIPITPPVKSRPAWRAALSSPAVKIILGLLVGVGLLFLVARFVNLPTTIAILRQHLATPRGITLALLSGVAFLLAFSIRGVRWKLFLNPIGKVSTLKAIQLFLVGIFLNFLLPVRGGEVAKSLMLKRIANIPVSKSLPTVAMDKALDLMPALLIMAIVPFLGIKMDIKLWIVLGLVSGLLVCLIFFIALAAWKRNAAINLLQKMTGMLPASIAAKIEGFATGFVDSLLMGASQPRIFVPAMLLTVVAVIFDGLFAMLAFWTIGFQISFGVAIFGYTVYNMFYILPTPPGQVGSNEAVGLLVFSGLLHLPADKVTAMFVFSHPWSALLMTVTAMICLSALGLKLSTAMKVQTEGESALAAQEQV
ncbi:MAG TPA: lysylphosphatidylglycerol synthase transmembrane domain-containing protein [Ktedonobacteraceae bacterium]|nr:lysylphosphatidylglycerol synthase transmembrane domain-containing protein [Ktedonobacteraceae bacterium]